jgi:hypothetical protein
MVNDKEKSDDNKKPGSANKNGRISGTYRLETRTNKRVLFAVFYSSVKTFFPYEWKRC